MTYVGLCLELNEHGFLRAIFVLTRHTKTDASLTTEEMFQGVVHAFTPDSGAILSPDHLFDKGGSLQDHKIQDAVTVAWCYLQPWCNVSASAGTCESSVREQAAVQFGLASSLEEVTPQNKEEAEEMILAKPDCAFMVEALSVGHAAAMASLGKKVSKGPGRERASCQAVRWRPIDGDWSEPYPSLLDAAVAMGLCERDDGNNCEAVKVVGFLRRNAKRAGPLYRKAVAKFEVKNAYDDDDEEEAASFEVPKRGSEPVRRAAEAWKDAVRKVSGRGSAGGRGQTHQYGRGDTPTAADFAAGFVGPTGPGGRGRGRPRGRGNGGGPPPPPPPPGPAPAPAPGPKKKKRKNTSGRHCG